MGKRHAMITVATALLLPRHLKGTRAVDDVHSGGLFPV